MEKPKSLLKTLLVPQELRPYVNNYRINLFEVSFLTEEQINMFKSDFKIVADYFVKSRKNKNYAGSKETFKHVNEVLQMMRAVTGDLRYSQLNDFVASQKGKPIGMLHAFAYMGIPEFVLMLTSRNFTTKTKNK